MKVENHRLIGDDGAPVPFVESPNQGGSLAAKYLVLHYTAGQSAASAIGWFRNSNARASAHLVIDRDGTITQMVPFNRVAWHAGQSQWRGLVGLNRHSIGIEIANAGRLQKHGNDWADWTGRLVDPNEVVMATHPHETTQRAWQAYPTAQVEATLQAAAALWSAYGLVECVGHEDIAPSRKIDPGPAFPMRNIQAALLGRQADDAADEADVFVTTEELNIRVGAGPSFGALPGSPLPTGTKVNVLARQGKWWQVDVLSPVSGLLDPQGWVHSGYLRPKGA